MVEFQLPLSAIPFSAFADVVEEYKEDSGTDDEGEMRNT